METVCAGKEWDVALAMAPDGTVAAAMPYLVGHRWGMRYVLQPQLTQYSGPWYRSESVMGDASVQFSSYFSHHGFLFFSQNFAPALNGDRHWGEYTYTERITYRIEDISDPQRVFEGFDKQRRQRPIRRAEKMLTVVEDVSPEEFARFHAAYWASRGQHDLLSQEFIINVVRTALERRQGMLLGVADAEGKLHAARFVAFDSNSAYSLLSALNPEGHHNGASALLFWRMIERLSNHTQSFDFEGSMDPRIAFSYRLYGARPVGYQHVVYYRNRLVERLLRALKLNI